MSFVPVAAILLPDGSEPVREAVVDALVWREAEPVTVKAESQVAVQDSVP